LGLDLDAGAPDLPGPPMDANPHFFSGFFLVSKCETYYWEREID